MLTPAEADRLIEQHFPCLPAESLPLGQCAGAVLRENICAERDQPPFDRVAMDGIAVNSHAVHAGRRRFRIQAMQAAGDAPLTLASEDCCIQIMTGAVLPPGCDAVIPVEQIFIANGEAKLAPEATAQPWQNVHRRGSDARQGAVLLRAGRILSSPEIAIAASAGIPRIQVSSQPGIVVVSTGNELIEPGEPILPHQVRRSNAYGIVAALRRRGFARVGDDHIPDDLDELRARLKLHLDTHEVLILSGGVSMGTLDLVPKVLQELGVQQIFHKIAQRPGKPFWFGIAPTGTTVFALPGNPVSTLVCLSRYVVPALFAAMGAKGDTGARIALGGQASASASLTSFVPVVIETDEDGRAWAQPRPTNGSGDFTALAGTDGFVELPPGPKSYPKGFVARLYHW